MEVPAVKKPDPPDQPFPKLPALPAMFQSVLPTPVPQIQYQPGVATLVTNFIHNWKLKQMVRESERQATIAENKTRQLGAQKKAILELLLYGEEYKTRLKEYEFQRNVMELLEKLGQQELIKIQMENQILYFQAQQEEIEFKIKLKNYEEMANGAAQTETRVDH